MEDSKNHPMQCNLSPSLEDILKELTQDFDPNVGSIEETPSAMSRGSLPNVSLWPMESSQMTVVQNVGVDVGSIQNSPTQMHIVIDETYNQSQGYIKQEVSSLTQAIPDISAPLETSLTLTITPSSHILHSSELGKVFTSPGDISLWTLEHPPIQAGQYIQMALNYTSNRLIQTPIKICDKREHQLRRLIGQCILFVDSEGSTQPMEMCQDPRTQKFSLKIYPERGTTSTQIRFAFECLNSCESSAKQDKHWVLLSHLYSPEGLVLQRCVTDVKVVVRPKAEMKREEDIVRKRKDGDPGRGRKRKNDIPRPKQANTKQAKNSIGLDQDESREIVIVNGGLSRRQDLENKIIAIETKKMQSKLKTKTVEDLEEILYNLRRNSTEDSGIINCDKAVQ